MEMIPLNETHGDFVEPGPGIPKSQSKSSVLAESKTQSQSRISSKETNHKEYSRINKSARRSIWLDTWLFEGIALAFAIACFIAICVILAIYDQKVRPETLLYDLTLNTFISVLATACKSSLVLVIGESISQLKWLWFQTSTSSTATSNTARGVNGRSLLDMQTFDAASRGPLGSLMIIFHHRAQSFVSLGALVLVFLLAFDPFIQQVLKYPVWLAPNSNEMAIAPQLREFMPGNSTMDKALSQGFWSDQDFTPPLLCPSGNCTWDPYSSVGFCNQCADITSLVVLDCHLPTIQEGFNGGFNETCNIDLVNAFQDDMSGHNFTVTFHDSESYEMGMPVLYFPDKIVWQPFNRILGYYDYGLMGQLLNSTLSGVKNPLWTNARAELELNTSGNASYSAPISNRMYVKRVIGCSLSLCLREYNVTVQNGNPSIETLATDFGRLYVNETHLVDDNEGYSLCWEPGSSNNINTNSNESNFGFCDPKMRLLAGKGSKYFPQGGGGAWLLKYHVWHKEPRDADEFYDTEIYNPALDRIESTGFEETMANIAASLNKLSLTYSSHRINGTVHTSEVFVDVQWPWISLPALLVVVGTVFSLVTMYVSQRSQLPLWKSSALAPFYHGLEWVEKEEYKMGAGMEKQAERVKVGLRHSEGHDRLMLCEKRSDD
ncbi:hypothetical protein VI817_009673 [Penicillium citrinum]|nr:hypothetical protein VI817_009673 [Penicillium citrinum]